MVRLPGQRHVVMAQAGDGIDDRDRQVGLLQHRPPLDVQFHEAVDVIAARRRTLRRIESGRAHRLGDRFVGIAPRGVGIARRDGTDDGTRPPRIRRRESGCLPPRTAPPPPACAAAARIVPSAPQWRSGRPALGAPRRSPPGRCVSRCEPLTMAAPLPFPPAGPRHCPPRHAVPQARPRRTRRHRDRPPQPTPANRPCARRPFRRARHAAPGQEGAVPPDRRRSRCRARPSPPAVAGRHATAGPIRRPD